ncbi:MAG TPA: crossover junction endodeoxyribonuclease RuvC [Clostridia bacterium]|nr:crossover junction endodeoxyribonuclease RuvC [Clostridia bacterium]
MRILGIDPGLATVGFGIIDTDGSKYTLFNYGVLTTPASASLPERLKLIYDGIQELIKGYSPDIVAVEELFFNTNVTTALNVAQARGTILIAARECTDRIYEYTPLQVKQAVVGYGRAGKGQIQRMVQALLNMPELPRPDDAADALAVALCHAHTKNLSELFRI